MTIHLLRDYLTRAPKQPIRWTVPLYILSLFLRRVLGFSHVGNTNFNINSVSTLLIATGDSSPTAATPTWAAGTKAGINLGAGREFEVSIPPAVRTVSGTDLNRLLVLKSTANSRFNSGVFLITGFNVSGGANSYIVDYRTMGDFPPAEAADSLEWYLYAPDILSPQPGTARTASSGEYGGNGNSTTPRVILQSPHVTGWQVRLCVETAQDSGLFGAFVVPILTICPGFDGNITGDFSILGRHTHGPLWFNSSSVQYMGATGLGDVAQSDTPAYRCYAIGDDQGQSISFFLRNSLTTNDTAPNHQYVSFGIPDNEPLPLPPDAVSRLYSLGGMSVSNSGNNMGNITFSTKANNANNGGLGTHGMGHTVNKHIASCVPSMWTYISGTTAQGQSPFFDTSAGDSPFVNSTELLPVDLAVGTVNGWGLAQSPALPFEPRIIGTIPYLKAGRANFGDFSMTTAPGNLYFHLKNGVFMLWEGSNVIP